MQYQGGKWVAGRWISEHLLREGRDCHSYLEPFVGGASVAARVIPKFGRAVAADVRPDLVMCWKAITGGWDPPSEVSESLYYELKYAKPSALRGFVGHCCSFGGRWFNGYARNGQGDSYAARGGKSCIAKAENMTAASWACADYRAWTPGEGWLVYADPPYEGVRDHKLPFNHAKFWETMRRWRKNGAVIVVSEYAAPTDWRCIDTLVTPATMAGAGTNKQIEGLWM